MTLKLPVPDPSRFIVPDRDGYMTFCDECLRWEPGRSPLEIGQPKLSILQTLADVRRRLDDVEDRIRAARAARRPKQPIDMRAIAYPTEDETNADKKLRKDIKLARKRLAKWLRETRSK